jgi:very-short-patch-repair endonuclease
MKKITSLKCIICGCIFPIEQRAMVTVKICSVSCKNKHKETLPKKTSPTQASYWVSKGMSPEEAVVHVSKLQKARSNRSVDYWIAKGYSEEESIKKVQEVQSENSKIGVAKYTTEQRRARSPFSPEYWIKKGYTFDQANAIVKANSSTISLDTLVSKYGQEQGTAKYEAMCISRKQNYSLVGYIEKHGYDKGTELWNKKFKNRPNSMAATKFFEKIREHIPPEFKVYCADTDGEYGINNAGEYYFYDFVVPDLKLCVEFHGDYWHCNPEKYDADTYQVQTGKFARDVWEHDAKKHQALAVLRDINTMVVWESTANQSIFEIIKEIENAIKSKNSQ